jgi:hypothetical protein
MTDLTPQLSGHRRGCQPARDRIVSQAIIGAAAFILLKAGVSGQESAKQAEIRLAGLPTILCIGRCGSENPLAERDVHMQWLWERELPQDMANWPGITTICYLDHSFS